MHVKVWYVLFFITARDLWMIELFIPIIQITIQK
jgi:hypothetical protein